MVIFNPLTAKTPKEVPLLHAPLVRVIAQVRFEYLLSMKEEAVALFQNMIRAKYPLLKREQIQSVFMVPQGLAPASQTVWRFMDMAETWRVSLAHNFIALETTDYVSRHDFLERLETLLVVLSEVFGPTIVERFGLRYIDRLVDQDVRDVSDLVRAEMSGIVGLNFGGGLQGTTSEAYFLLPETDEQMITRWGLLSPGTTFDPDAIEPITEVSWILDIDISLARNRVFNIDDLMQESQHFAERIYTFFRWAVKDEFLRRFGGER